VRPVGEPVEHEDDDRIHAARRLSRAACPKECYRGTLATTVPLKPSRYPAPIWFSDMKIRTA